MFQYSSSHLLSFPLASFPDALLSLSVVTQFFVAAIAPPSEGTHDKLLMIVDGVLHCIEGLSVILIPGAHRMQIPFLTLFDKLANEGLATIVEVGHFI